MGRIKIENVGEPCDGTVAVMCGDPASEGAHTIVKLKPGASCEVEVRGDPESEDLGSEAVILCEDGPWVDEQMTADDGHDGSVQ